MSTQGLRLSSSGAAGFGGLLLPTSTTATTAAAASTGSMSASPLSNFGISFSKSSHPGAATVMPLTTAAAAVTGTAVATHVHGSSFVAPRSTVSTSASSEDLSSEIGWTTTRASDLASNTAPTPTTTNTATAAAHFDFADAAKRKLQLQLQQLQQQQQQFYHDEMDLIAANFSRTDLAADPHKRLGHLRFEKVLGEGTTGKVRLAVNTLTLEKVAVKCVKKNNLEGKAIERIGREVHVLKTLKHPNIARLLDIMETADELFLVLEYASGGELFDYIVHQQRVKEKEARRFFRQIVSALQYCHSNNIIHRDLKPENLLLDDNQNIKIIDFGFANIVKPGKLLETFCGSPAYAAPEMISGQKYEGPEVDVWSIGVILYALLCGFLPFDDDNHARLFKMIMDATYVFPDFLSESSRDLISRLLQKNPADRLTLDQIRHHPWVNEGCTSLIPFTGDAKVSPLLADSSLSSPVLAPVKLTRVNMSHHRASSESYIDVAALHNNNPGAFRHRHSDDLSLSVLSFHQHQQQQQSPFQGSSYASSSSSSTSQSVSPAPTSGLSPTTSTLGGSTSVYRVHRRRSQQHHVEIQPNRGLQTITEDSDSDTGTESLSGFESMSTTPATATSSASSSATGLHAPRGRHTPSPDNDVTSYLASRYRRHSEQLFHPPTFSNGLVPTAARKRKQSYHPSMHTRPEQIPRQSAPSSLSVTPQMYPFSSPTTAPLDSVVLAPVISFQAPKMPTSSRVRARAGRMSMGTDEVTTLRAFQKQRQLYQSQLHQQNSPQTAQGDGGGGQAGRGDHDASGLGELRTLRGVYNVDTTSTRHPIEVVHEIRASLKAMGVTYVNDPVHQFDCQIEYGAGYLQFEMEVCIVPKVSLTGIHMKRKLGDTWAYKDLCQRLVAKMNL